MGDEVVVTEVAVTRVSGTAKRFVESCRAMDWTPDPMPAAGVSHAALTGMFAHAAQAIETSAAAVDSIANAVDRYWVAVHDADAAAARLFEMTQLENEASLHNAGGR